MTWILLGIIAVLAMILVGWISFSKSDDEATITIQSLDMREEAERVVAKGKEFLNSEQGRRRADKSE